MHVKAAVMLPVLLMTAVEAAVQYVAKEQEYVEGWRRLGQAQLQKALKWRKDKVHQVAKNVILFIGDGMGMSTITAARIYKGQLLGKTGEEYELSFEAFPNVGLAKTYEVDSQTPDSGGAATAIFTGVKVNFDVLGMDARIKKGECDQEKYRAAKLDNLFTWSHQSGKYTGLVTTTSITDATPAAVYSHIGDRYWSCDAKVPAKYKNCTKDIARQLVENEPGRNIRVVMGGGLAALGATVVPKDATYCVRQDGRNLVEEWKLGPGHRLFVNSSRSLMDADLDEVEYLLGVFSPNHMPYYLDRADGPTLSDMTRQAIKMLSRNPKGYFLLVEGGNIDNAHHYNLARHALADTAELDDAVALAINLTDPQDTLIIVTADHSHSLTINGYTDRGNDILGLAEYSTWPLDQYQETLTYANGPGFDTHWRGCQLDGGRPWRVVPDDERKQATHRHFSPWRLKKETHTGEDVPVYAVGPHSDLVAGVFEQNYIAHVIGFAACVGPGARSCDVSTGMTISFTLWLIPLAVGVLTVVFYIYL